MPEVLSRDEFIEENLGLVHSVCRHFVGRGIEYDDLYGAGCVGLVKAADGFDESRGLMFSTYAVPVIMGEVRRLFRDGGAVKVSRSIKDLSVKINRVKPKLEQKLGREPSVSEIAEELSVCPEDVTEAVCSARPTVSLTFEGEDGVSDRDLPVCFEDENIENRIMISSVFSKLQENEKQIIYFRYYKLMTQSATAAKLNMTQVQVSRAEKKILGKMRKCLE